MGLVLFIAGLYLILTPILAVLTWIPLVGALMSKVAFLASFIFALVIALTISLIIVALAWILFRPLAALGMVLLAGIGVYFIFFWKPEGVW